MTERGSGSQFLGGIKREDIKKRRNGEVMVKAVQKRDDPGSFAFTRVLNPSGPVVPVLEQAKSGSVLPRPASFPAL